MITDKIDYNKYFFYVCHVFVENFDKIMTILIRKEERHEDPTCIFKILLDSCLCTHFFNL
jgi:hypothetical protein